MHDVTCIYFVKMVYKSTAFKYLTPVLEKNAIEPWRLLAILMFNGVFFYMNPAKSKLCECFMLTSSCTKAQTLK